MYKRNKSKVRKSRKIRNGRKSRINRKSRIRRIKRGGCDDCNKSGSSPSTAKLWTSGGSNEEIFKHEVDPIFYSSSI